VGSEGEGGEAAETYLRVREREGRILADQLVADLPIVPDDHPHVAEWRLRADSAERLIGYLRGLGRPLKIVELGCGNGWLSSHLARLEGSQVVFGVDNSAVELEQARRVFGRQENLMFARADMVDDELPIDRPDIVVMAAALQYVPAPGPFLARIARTMAPHGELHVLDTRIYESADVPAAQERSRRYYDSVGVPQMASHYHHHDWAGLGPLPFDVLYRPDGSSVLGPRRSPFPWIRFRVDSAR
jgi:SAM-dependent methyltransferase